MITEETAPPEFQALLDSEFPCLKRTAFFYFLEEELIRARRENHYVSISLFRLASPSDSLHDPLSAETLKQITTLLKTRLRRTDYLGYLGRSTFGIILLNSDFQGTLKATERLSSECLYGLIANHPDLEPSVSMAIYPSEANSAETLYEIALRRFLSPSSSTVH